MDKATESQRQEEEFLKLIREKEVWDSLSKSDRIPWSEKLIEKYIDKWNWSELCANENIPWNDNLIEKFKYKIDWDSLSENLFDHGFRCQATSSTNWILLKTFEAYWNWHKLSEYVQSIPNKVLELHADKWNWKELIDNRNMTWSYENFNEFKRYIPFSDFDNLKRSALWEKLVEHDEAILLGKILAD